MIRRPNDLNDDKDINIMKHFRLTFFLAGLGWVLTAAAIMPITPGAPGEYTKTKQSSALYAAPDPAETGGISGRLAGAPGRILGVLAQPQDEWKKLYLAKLEPDGSFRFAGLPASKYDLIVLCEKGFYEGLLLQREETAKPVEANGEIWKALIVPLAKSNPFFETKCLYRASSAGLSARGLLQEMRCRPVTLQSAEVRSDIQIRSLKLVLIEDVGAGWCVENTREYFRQEIGPKDAKGLLPGQFCEKLRGIRVTTTVKELGTLELPALPAAPQANVKKEEGTK
jgi:hypothetical protein